MLPSLHRVAGLVLLALPAFAGCVPDHPPAAAVGAALPAPSRAGRPYAASDPREVHLRDVRQLTFDGENAEAYWDFQGRRLSFQRTGPDGGCDQIYTMDLVTGGISRISDGTGRTTCSYFYPAGDRVLYASTHSAGPECPTRPDFSQGYVWAVYPSFDIFVADTLGNVVQRLTDRLGYDGGAFFSSDGSRIVWRADYPETPAAIADYRSLLAQHLIRPTTLELWVANADGSDARQITHLGAASFAPFFDPSGKRIVFSSNVDDPQGRDFDLYMIGVDGTGLERLTWTPGFDGFPMFSPDGRYLAFGSNRNESHPGNTNIFLAEWVERPPETPRPGS